MRGRGVRRALHVSGGTLASLLACLVVAAGGLDGALFESSVLAVTLMASVTVLVVATTARRVGFHYPSARSQQVSFWLARAATLADIEMSLALVAGCFAALAVSGGMSSPAYPLLYAVVAFAATFQTRAGAWTSVLAALALEGAAFLRAGDSAGVAALLHATFIAGAGLVHVVFLRGLVARQRRDHNRRIGAEIDAQRQSARDYRLMSAALGAESRVRQRGDEEQMLAAGGVQSISAALYHDLRLLKRCLDATTCMLLWVGDDARYLKIKERVTDAEDVTEHNVVKASGIIAAIVHKRTAMVMSPAKPGQVAYVESSRQVAAFVGVPVLDGVHLRGVLCADREAPFDEREVELMTSAAEQILRAIQTEQVFLAVERSKYEHERFYQASAMLCRALTIEQVMDTAFAAAAQITDHDVAVVAIYDDERNRHRVHSVRVRPGAEHMVDASKLAGLEFRPNSGLAAMVVKNKHYLPAGGEPRDASTPIYTKRIKFKDTESLLILPLLSADEAVGTFMLASRQSQRFGKDVREMLGIIANQVAISLQNAMMYKKMETMATTDGLTGLTNHRTFQEGFANLLERSSRHGYKAAMLLCDVDHFKKVNDVHGHPVGDEVLRRVAAVLQAAVRKIDITARYGGEEFAVVLEATDLDGAKRLAERIREDVGALILDSDKGAFRITMSIGVAAFPEDSRDRAELIERSDLALYHAKESGRNRVVTYQQFSEARRSRKAS